MASNTRWEIIRSADGSPLGFTHRAWDHDRLETLVVFTGDDGERRRSSIALDGSSWTTSQYWEWTGSEDPGSPVEISAVTLLEEEDAIPSDLEFLLLHQAIRDAEPGSDETLSFHTIFAGDPRGRAREASMWSPEPGVWEIEVDGELESTHWVEGGSVVRSRIGGAEYVAASPDEVIAAVAGLVEDGLLAGLAR